MRASEIFTVGDEVKLSKQGERNLIKDNFTAIVVGFSRDGRCVWIRKTHCKHSQLYSRNYIEKTRTTPLCKCEKPCQYYGEVGGYSVACIDCNEKNAKRQRVVRRLEKSAKETNTFTDDLNKSIKKSIKDLIDYLEDLTPEQEKELGDWLND